MRLHIGSKGQGIPGFKKLDLVQYGDVDFVQDAKDMSNFSDNTVDEVYCSHILEHWPHIETVNVLREWRRVLKPNGKAWISVPDLMRCIEFVKREPASEWAINLLYGDQNGPLAFHYVTFTYPILARKLVEAGFSDVRRINDMPYGLRDASQYVDSHYKMPISLNVEATA